MAAAGGYKNFAEFEQALFERQRKMKDVLPPGLKIDRFLALTKVWVGENRQLLGCGQNSLMSAVYKAARDGMEIGTDAVIITYDGKEARYMQQYAGIITQVTRTGLVAKVFAEVVYSGDEFTLDYGSSTHPIRHIPKRRERGELEGAYAAIIMKTGIWHVHYMDEPDIERVLSEQRHGKMKDNDPWVRHRAEMWRKTALHNASKYFPTSLQIGYHDDGVVVTAQQHIDELFDRADGAPEAQEELVGVGVPADDIPEPGPGVFTGDEEGF